jgi:catechol 2,3-dioxygenase-like lactoylglutathione lyase family enzyme
MADSALAASAITGIEGITYGVTDVETSHKFFDAFGLETVESVSSGVTFQTPEGAAIRFIAAGDASLSRLAPMEPGSTVRELIWSVASRGHLDALATELSFDREASIDSSGTLRSVDAMGLPLAFRVSSIVRKPYLANATHTQGTRAPRFERARPVHLGHAVFFTGNFDESVAFYRDRLGFTLSDTLLMQGNVFGAFLRAPGAINHHNMFLIKSSAPGINHISFRVDDFGEMMSGRTFMEASGFACAWGLGRHAPSSAMFNYFPTPAGGFAEYHFDEDVILDPAAWQPKGWDVTAPGSTNQWVGRAPEAMHKNPNAPVGAH